MKSQPNNNSTKKNPVGRFMVAVGAIVELRNTGKILISQRASNLDWQADEWEIIYGRLDQFEDLETGLKREIKEETGLNDIEIVSILSTWHIFRGTKRSAQNELIGITFHCRIKADNVRLSNEHAAYKFVSPDEALELVNIKGIRKDITKFKQHIREQ